MPTSRRDFLRSAAASGALAAFPQGSWPSNENDLRKKLASEPLRPQFHLLPAKNWMNDPNGPIYWNGLYHMFFQYNPNAAVWGDMHWAHAVSEDMIHWRHLPIALAPTPGWDDADGCFTGSAVGDHGTATILYTGVKTVPAERATLRDAANNFRETQCLATSNDPQLRTWTKFPHPVIQPPVDPSLTGFRDPFLWRHGDHWLLGVAAGHFKKGGCVRLYRSKDLRVWEYLHELASGHWTEKESKNAVDSGEMWECPDFFPLGKKYVLLYATAGSVVWESGDLDPKTLKFHSQRRGLLDHGAYYAQKTQLDARGNRILWGWIPEKRPDSELIAAGWAGCMAMPRVLSLSPDGELEMRVAPEAQSLRTRSFALPKYDSLTRSDNIELPGLTLENLCAELKWELSIGLANIWIADRQGMWWSMSYSQENSKASVVINFQQFEIPALSNEPPLRSLTSKPSFHLFLDGSVAELIVNNRHAFTSRIYRKPDGPLRISVSALTKFASFESWQLKPISPDRLTT
jgi:beta-fructofuranosidase